MKERLKNSADEGDQKLHKRMPQKKCQKRINGKKRKK